MLSIELYIFIVLALLVLSAFFSGSETALFSITKSDLYNMAFSNSTRENMIAKLMKKPQKILITILIGNLVVNILLTTLTTDLLLSSFGPYGHFIAIGVVTPIVIIFCEIVPKVLSNSSPNIISRLVVRPLYLFDKILFPARILFIFISNTLIRLFKLNPNRGDYLSAKEIDIALRVNESHGYLDKHESNFIKNVLRFSKKSAENVMIPRNKAIAVPHNASIDELATLFQKTGVLRVPVYKNDLDQVLGIIDSRNLIPYIYGLKKGKSIKRLIEPVTFYPESKELVDLLEDFLKNKIQMAVLLDEYGGTSGIVTLSSIISEVMGDNFQLDDVAQKPDIRKTSSAIIVAGDMQIHDFNDMFKTKIESSEAETIGGYVIEQSGAIPKKGETIELEKYSIKVRHIAKNELVSLELTKK